MIANAYFTTFFSLYIFQVTKSQSLVGIIQFAFFGGYIVGAYFAHHLIEKYKHIACYLVVSLFFSLLHFLISFPLGAFFWFFMRFLSGFCIAILYIILESWLLIIASRFRLGSGFSLYMIGLYLSQSLGQFIINCTEYLSIIPFLFAGCMTLISTMPLLFMKTPLIQSQVIEKTAFTAFFKQFPLTMTIAGFSGLIVGIFFVYCPLLMDFFHIPVGTFMGLALLGGLLFQFPVGWISDHMPRARLLLILTLFLFAALVALYTYTYSPSLMLLLSFLFGGALFTVYPLTISTIAENFEANSYTSLCAKVLFIYSTGSTIGPLIASLSLSRYTVSSLFPLMGAISLLCILFATTSLIIQTRPSPPLSPD